MRKNFNGINHSYATRILSDSKAIRSSSPRHCQTPQIGFSFVINYRTSIYYKSYMIEKYVTKEFHRN